MTPGDQTRARLSRRTRRQARRAAGRYPDGQHPMARPPSVDRVMEIESAQQAEIENRPPTGSVSELLAWAGDDPDRRAALLTREQSAAKPRKTLLEALEA